MATPERRPRLGTKAFVSTLDDWAGTSQAPLHRRLEYAIRQAIETGLLPTGTVLPAERTMARSLGVSRSTVTTSLNDLKAQGLLEARHGSGTAVASSARSQPAGSRSDRSGAVDADVIDLAASSPADARALPPVDVDFDEILRSGPRHGYTPAGLAELRHSVSERFTGDGLPTRAEQILITNGAQHALALAFSELAEPDDAIIVDNPTYPGIVDLLNARRLRPVPLPRRSGGVDPDQFDALVRSSGARLAYLQTLVHNPTGQSADEQSLGRLAQTMADNEVTVIEDLVLADLRFDGKRPAPLAARVSPGRVVVVGSVSKLGWGGLRIGWLRAEGELVDRLVRSRLADDLGSSIPSQVISAAVLAQFDVIAESRQRSLARRAALVCRQLAERCPTWELLEPDGGLSLWITLDRPCAEALAQRAADEGVIIATGRAASVAEDDDRNLRLCFDRPEAQLLEGLDRLVRAWEAVRPNGSP